MVSRPTDRRLHALRFLIAERRDGGGALIQRHPESALLEEHAVPSGRSFAELQWDELAELEAAVPDPSRARAHHSIRSTLSYVLRRRDVIHHLQWVEATRSLPPAWRRLIGMRADEMRSTCVALGIELCALACAGRARDELLGDLRELGAECAGGVALRLVNQAPVGSKPLRDVARQAFAGACAGRRGKRVLSYLGRRALAADFQRLSPAARAAAGRVAHSNIVVLLGQAEALPIRGAAVASELEDLLELALRPSSGDRARGGSR